MSKENLHFQGETAYVLTKEHACYTLWNPRDGKHYQSSDSFCPLRSVDCLVNGENVRHLPRLLISRFNNVYTIHFSI